MPKCRVPNTVGQMQLSAHLWLRNEHHELNNTVSAIGQIELWVIYYPLILQLQLPQT
jgi:hypothetical protein